MSEDKNLGDHVESIPEKNIEYPLNSDDIPLTSRQIKPCKSCGLDILSVAKICPHCKSNQQWFFNYFRIGDVLLFLSISVSALMVIFSYWNFHESREERVKAAVALTTAQDAATKASDAVTRANEAATKVSQAETAVSGTVARMKKIEESSLGLNNAIKQIQVKTNNGFREFEANFKYMNEERATLAIYYNARGGERSALNDLIKLGKDAGSRKGTLVKSLIADTQLFFRDYKFSTNNWQIIDLKTKTHYRPAAEQLYGQLHNSEDQDYREAVINEISDRKFEYFVNDLVKITLEDPHLKVACKAERAIEKLTGEKFDDFPPYSEVEGWWDKTGSKEKKYYNNLHRLSELPKRLTAIDAAELNVLLDDISNSQQGMCISHFNKAKVYLLTNQIDEAKKHLKIATEQCDRQIDAMRRYAELLYSEGGKNDVIDMLSKMKPWMPDEALFEKECRTSFKNIENEERFKKLFEKK